MRTLPFLLLFVVSNTVSQDCKAQTFKKGFLEQGFEYYYETENYEKARIALDSLFTHYDLRSVKLDYALNVAVKYKQKALTSALLKELNRDFNEQIGATEIRLEEWLPDSKFSFARFYGKKWAGISISLEAERQKMEDNLKGDYYNTLMGFLNVDQFARFNNVTKTTFIEVDSINLNNFTEWLIGCPENLHIKSRLNNQILVALLRHVGPKRLELLTDKGVFQTLLSLEMISAQDYGLIVDYVLPKPLYFIEYDAFVEQDWAKSGIQTPDDLKKLDQKRLSIGLLPLEYSGFCIRKKLIVPEKLKYAQALDLFMYR